MKSFFPQKTSNLDKIVKPIINGSIKTGNADEMRLKRFNFVKSYKPKTAVSISQHLYAYWHSSINIQFGKCVISEYCYFVILISPTP